MFERTLQLILSDATGREHRDEVTRTTAWQGTDNLIRSKLRNIVTRTPGDNKTGGGRVVYVCAVILSGALFSWPFWLWRPVASRRDVLLARLPYVYRLCCGATSTA